MPKDSPENTSPDIADTVSPLEKVARLRQLLAREGLDGFILPHEDEFLGEYTPPSAERLAWLTGFTGSAGTAVVTQDSGAVFSDGRYTEQMEKQLSPFWERHNVSIQPVSGWLNRNSEKGKRRVGYDPKITSPLMLDRWQSDGIELVPLESNPVDQLWRDRPSPPASPIFVHELKYSGRSSLAKRQDLGEALKKRNLDACLIADCTLTMWLGNLRGNDVPMTPLALGYGLFFQNGHGELFIDPARLQGAPEDSLLTLRSPEQLADALTALKGKRIGLDPATAPLFLAQGLDKADAQTVWTSGLADGLRAVKNETEIKGHRQAQFLDNVALVRFFHWLEENGIGMGEADLADQLDQFRAASPFYRGQSFEAISAVNENAALPHYRTERETQKKLTPNSIYLLDSGGQYPYGTTDLTRTLWIGPGEAPAEIKDRFTRVLKGHIALACARFPAGSPGYRLDILARQPLWEIGEDFDHGTGHGIGSYLSVHEGPQSISPAPRTVGLQENMLLSNEPGFYKKGAYGIRIENLMRVKKCGIREGQDLEKNRPFLAFETLSFVPIDRNLVEISLLNKQEVKWLNAYHAEVLEKLMPHLATEDQKWLKKACAEL